jgi:hypothetical protein
MNLSQRSHALWTLLMVIMSSISRYSSLLNTHSVSYTYVPPVALPFARVSFTYLPCQGLK